MIVYHYLPKEANYQNTGILTLSKLPKELIKYGPRFQQSNPKEIIQKLETTFPGRTRSVSVLTEPIQTKGNDPMLSQWIKTKQLVEIDLDALIQNHLVESIWCKLGSNAAGKEEQFQKIIPSQIDFSPLDWSRCSQEKGLFFGVIRHYLLVMKEGVIPPFYLHSKD